MTEKAKKIMYKIAEKKYSMLRLDGETSISRIDYMDSDGYLYSTTVDKVLNRNGERSKCHPGNVYSIYNINKFAEINGVKSRCVSNVYIHAKDRLEFKCDCGNHFFTAWTSFSTKHKVVCDDCSGYTKNLSYEELVDRINEHGLKLLIKKEEFKGITKTPLVCSDKNGYKKIIKFHELKKKVYGRIVEPSNPYSIDNINLYLKKHGGNFRCVSNAYVDKKSSLEFICLRCEDKIFATWGNICKSGNRRSGPTCPNCDGTVESLHAIALKQIFMHEYEDTVIEDRSFINPETGCAMPTDIVNHRLKIAIEVQSQWHDFDDKKDRDRKKKDYWLSRGYSFYDPDIRDYTILEICKLFFDIDRIPDYVNLKAANKIDIKRIQRLLNSGMKVPKIAEELGITSHRIYDAIHDKKLFYPPSYNFLNRTRVIQFDMEWNYLKEYESFSQAAKDNGLIAGNITSVIYTGVSYSHGGFRWLKKEDYIMILRYLSHLSSETAVA